MSVVRHAIYWAPEGELAAWGAAWLGWDPDSGREVPQPDRVLGPLTEEPRRYGLHATLKPPFRLAPGRTEEELAAALAALAARLAPAEAPGLAPSRIGRFLALTPEGDGTALSRLAARCVAELDPFRAPPTEADLARRRASQLDTEEEANLVRWGYPHVMGRFRFHVTLTGALGEGQEETVRAALARHPPPLPRPFLLGALAHLGEGEDGRFRLLHRYTLSG